MAFNSSLSLWARSSAALLLSCLLGWGIAPRAAEAAPSETVELPAYSVGGQYQRRGVDENGRYVWVDQGRKAVNLYDYFDEKTLFTEDNIHQEINIDDAMSLCLKENKNSCYEAASVFMKQFNTSHKNMFLERAIELFHRSCSLGRADACYRLGKAITLAESRVIDLRQVLRTPDVRAVKLDSFTKAATLADPVVRGDSFKCLAEFYLNRAEDRDRVYEYSAKGCDLHNPDACYLQGITLWLCTVEGYTVSQCEDNKERKRVMLRAFEKGTRATNPEYKSNSWYFLGYELDQLRDYSGAIHAFIQGCKLNNENACFFAGIAFEDGKGAKRNVKKALNYYHKACDLGAKYGCERVQKLAIQGIRR